MSLPRGCFTNSMSPMGLVGLLAGVHVRPAGGAAPDMWGSEQWGLRDGVGVGGWGAVFHNSNKK